MHNEGPAAVTRRDGDPGTRRVITATAEHDRVPRAWFDSGQCGPTAEPVLEGRCLESPADRQFFRHVRTGGTSGTIRWPNGADFRRGVVFEVVTGRSAWPRDAERLEEGF